VKLYDACRFCLIAFRLAHFTIQHFVASTENDFQSVADLPSMDPTQFITAEGGAITATWI